MISSRFALSKIVFWLVASIFIAGLLPEMVAAQPVRIEVHPIQTMTLTNREFLTGAKDGKPAVIAGELRIPLPGTARLPAVILVHGSSGVGSNVDSWSRELNGIGVATFLLDCFTGRGIVSTVTNQAQLGGLTMIYDAYRALELLSKHPRIDPARIAIMGFSRGGMVALYASLKRFQRMHGPKDVEFAAYLPFYAPCNTKFIDETEVSDRPIRLFHGLADDYTPIVPCRLYVERLRAAGKDVRLAEYPDAHHGFDASTLKAPVPLPRAQTTRRCSMEEKPSGQIVNSQTNRPFTLNDPCVERGTTVAYNAQAHSETLKAVEEFLTVTFKLQEAHE